MALVPVLLALALTGCSGSGSGAGGPAPAATAPDDHDLQLLSTWHTSIKEWNAVTGPVVTAFRDPSVTAEQFVQMAQPTVPKIQMLARAIASGTLGLHDSGISSAMLQIGTGYQAEAVDYGLLIEAASRGDQPSQTAILARLTAQGQENSQQALALVAYLRSKYGNEFADAFAG